MHDISVIISSYNGLNKLKIALSAYKNQTLQNFEVIVASDGSSDGTLEFIKENTNRYPYRLRCVWQPDQGYRLARIRNCAWRIADSERVVFTDQDIVPNSDCLANYAKYKNEDIAIAGYIGWIDENIHKIFTEDSVSKINNFDPFMTEPEMRNFRKYDWNVLWGGNMSYLKEAFVATGGFDEEFIGWGGEDTDLGLRYYRAGKPIKTLAEAKMFHLNHPPSNSLNRTGSELYYKIKQYDKSFKRNAAADYSDVVEI